MRAYSATRKTSECESVSMRIAERPRVRKHRHGLMVASAVASQEDADCEGRTGLRLRTALWSAVASFGKCRWPLSPCSLCSITVDAPCQRTLLLMLHRMLYDCIARRGSQSSLRRASGTRGQTGHSQSACPFVSKGDVVQSRSTSHVPSLRSSLTDRLAQWWCTV